VFLNDKEPVVSTFGVTVDTTTAPEVVPDVSANVIKFTTKPIIHFILPLAGRCI
jgi:hypothetical protein